jgi:hypothetical protein
MTLTFPNNDSASYIVLDEEALLSGRAGLAVFVRNCNVSSLQHLIGAYLWRMQCYSPSNFVGGFKALASGSLVGYMQLQPIVSLEMCYSRARHMMHTP